MVIDKRWVNIGSFNLDSRSFNHDFEQNVVIDNVAFAEHVISYVFDPFLEIITLLSEPYPIRLNLLERFIQLLT